MSSDLDVLCTLLHRLDPARPKPATAETVLNGARAVGVPTIMQVRTTYQPHATPRVCLPPECLPVWLHDPAVGPLAGRLTRHCLPVCPPVHGWLEQASDLSLADGRLNLCLLAQLFHACNGLAISNDELQQYFAVSGEVRQGGRGLGYEGGSGTSKTEGSHRPPGVEGCWLLTRELAGVWWRSCVSWTMLATRVRSGRAASGSTASASTEARCIVHRHRTAAAPSSTTIDI